VLLLFDHTNCNQEGQDMAEGHPHGYAARVIWTGNRGAGTTDYASYGREHRIVVAGKPELEGSADAAFRGSPDRHNPEELFLAAIAACQMLFYLSLCARQGVRVLSYEGEASGSLALGPDGGGRFDVVTLTQVVTVARGTDLELATRLDDVAHERCFIANSCSVPIVRRLRLTTDAVPAGAA
jgi:organic hydroperoxide reductase OsmC/OhrA